MKPPIFVKANRKPLKIELPCINRRRMKSTNSLVPLVLTLLLGFSTLQAQQNPLIGTWEMISARGIGADGERFSFDSTSTKEVKIITERHYMLIACTKEGDSLVFNRSYAGTIKIYGTRYIEKPMYSSNTIFDDLKVDFTWTLRDGNFIQSGSLIRPDGKKIILEEMIFRRLQDQGRNPYAGVWNQVSSEYNIEGKTVSHTNATVSRLYFLTPEYWMQFSSRNGKFEYALGGTHKTNAGRSLLTLEFGSIPSNGISKIQITHTAQENKLYSNGEVTLPGGQISRWKDVYERVE